MWVLNGILYLWFLQGLWTGDYTLYKSAVAAGYPCYAVLNGTTPSTPQPVCFYDPSNTNQAVSNQ